MSGFGSITEPDHFTQVQKTISNGDQIGINLFKQKMQPFSLGYKLEAPTAIELSFAKTINLTKDHFINFSVNLGLSAGITIASPMFQNNSNASVNFANSGPSVKTGTSDAYQFAGYSASAIGRLDATVHDRFVAFIAFNLHDLLTTDQQVTINGVGSTEKSRNFSSFGITGGVGINMGHKKTKKRL